MKLEIITLCDHAADYGGKVSLNGAFDRVHAKEAPFILRNSTFYARVRFDPSEEGQHQIRISFIDADARAVIPALTGELPIRFGNSDRTLTVNVIMNFHNLKLAAFGEYTVEFAVGGTVLGSIPLYFDPAPQVKQG
jgi:hypothetical protein